MEDSLIFKMVYPFFRYAAEKLAGVLVGWAIFTEQEGTLLATTVASALAVLAINLYFSWREKVTQKKEVLVARASPENTPLKAIEAQAADSTLKGNTVVPKEAA